MRKMIYVKEKINLDEVICRKMKSAEIQSALALSLEVFMEFEAPIYSKKGVEEFQKSIHSPKYLKGIEYYGAFYHDTLVGVLGIRKSLCHICFFFVEKDFQHMGVGTKLFREMEKRYENRTITLNSSPVGLPFYKKLGFIETTKEQEVNGIRFTPMLLKNEKAQFCIAKLSERRDLKRKAAQWFNDKWGIPKKAYEESIEDSFEATVPAWYVYLEGDKIIAGMGVIENDFHDRPDLAPNICAVYTEAYYRNQGIAGKLLNYVCQDMKEQGIDTLYLLTDHIGFYERYGWEFYCMAMGDGEDKPSRMYVHRL